MSDLGTVLQRMGAGFQGNLAQFDAARTQQEILKQEAEKARRTEAKALSQERAVAAAQDAQIALQFIEAGAVDKALGLIDNRLQQINKLGGDPSDTQAMRDLIAAGKIDEAKNELSLFTTEAEARGLIKPIAKAQPSSDFGKRAVDEGLKPGTPEFAARVLQLSMPEPKQPRMVEQGGVQYWAEGPNAGKPVVGGASSQASPIDQFTKRFGAVPQGMTPEIIVGSVTGRVVPMGGSEKDPATIAAARAAKIQEDMPTARNKFMAVSQPLQAMKKQIQEIRKDPNTPDVIGSYEGRTSGGILGRFGGSNTTAASRIENLRNVAQSIGLNLTRQGGVAPGSITEREWPKFEAFVANLDTKQDEKAFFKQLNQAEMMADEILKGMEEDFTRTYGESPMRRKEDTTSGVNIQALIDKYAPR